MISEKKLIKRLKANLITSTINKERIKLIKEFLKRRISTELCKKIKN